MNNFIGELHKIFDYYNHEKFNGELIEPVITVQREKSKKKGVMVLGWCSTAPRWIKFKKEESKEELQKTGHYEINITLDYIDRPTNEIIATFLHEMAHLANGQANISDCNRKQYHNDKFRVMAEKLGLIVSETSKGWNQTELSDEAYNELLELDDFGSIDLSKLKLSNVEQTKERKPVDRKPMYKYRCPKCSKEVKSKSDDLLVKCGDCEVDFVNVEN